MNRQETLNKLEQYKYLPKHRPNLEKMTDEQLKKYLKVIEASFEDYFED